MAVAKDAVSFPHGFGNGLPQRDANVFYGVVGIHIQIPLGADVQINAAMAGHLVQHVLEERQPGV